jgi:hypothetical protein
VEWRDPVSGYLRRNVSPPGVPQPMQIVEVRFPPGGRVAFETGSRDVLVHQQIWVLEGAIDITLGEDCYHLARAIAWPCSSTARSCSTTPRESRRATRW